MSMRAGSHRFVHALERLFARDRGLRARLHRNAGLIADAGPELLDWYAFLGSQPYLLDGLSPAEARRREEVAYLVATLMASDRRRVAPRAGDPSTQPDTAEEPEREEKAESLGRTLRRLVRRDVDIDGDPISRRLRILLDADLDVSLGGTLPYRLRRLITLALSRDARIDWAGLLTDLESWEHPDRFVQRRWARDFFTAPSDVADDGGDDRSPPAAG
jgi:CRISPR system Cascade subunit CasB